MTDGTKIGLIQPRKQAFYVHRRVRLAGVLHHKFVYMIQKTGETTCPQTIVLFYSDHRPQAIPYLSILPKTI